MRVKLLLETLRVCPALVCTVRRLDVNLNESRTHLAALLHTHRPHQHTARCGLSFSLFSLFFQWTNSDLRIQIAPVALELIWARGSVNCHFTKNITTHELLHTSESAFLIGYIWTCCSNRTWKVPVKPETGELKRHRTVNQNCVVYALSLFRPLRRSLSKFCLSVSANNVTSYQGSGHVGHSVFVKVHGAPRSDAQTWSWFGCCDTKREFSWIRDPSLSGFICLSYCFRNQTKKKKRGTRNTSSFIFQLENISKANLSDRQGSLKDGWWMWGSLKDDSSPHLLLANNNKSLYSAVHKAVDLQDLVVNPVM